MPDSYNNIAVFGGLVTCAVGVVGFGLLVAYLRREKSRRKFVEVGVVSQLYIHPIKSCRGLEVSQLHCASLGMESDGLMDRSFLLLDNQNNLVTGKIYPSIALIASSLSSDEQSLLVDAPGMPTLTLPLKGHHGLVIEARILRQSVKGEDCGQEASEWLSQYLGGPGYKIIRHSERLQGIRLQDDSKWGIKSKEHERAIYQYTGQAHILGAASLDSLNSRLEKPVQIRNFRPNIVVGGSSAFSEDEWKYVRIGDQAVLRKTHLVPRCLQTTVDPDTGKLLLNGEPLKTLRKFRMSSPDDPDKSRYGPAPLLGTMFAFEQLGKINIGDVVYACKE